MEAGEDTKIGRLLLAEGVVTAEELAECAEKGGWKDTALGHSIAASPAVNAQELGAFLAAQSTVPHLTDLREVKVMEVALQLISADMAVTRKVLPLAVGGGILFLAAENPLDVEMIRAVRAKSGLRLKVIQADAGQLSAAIEIHFQDGTGEIPAPEEEFELVELEEVDPEEVEGAVLEPKKPSRAQYEEEANSPVARLLREFEMVHASGKPVTPLRLK